MRRCWSGVVAAEREADRTIPIVAEVESKVAGAV